MLHKLLWLRKCNQKLNYNQEQMILTFRYQMLSFCSVKTNAVFISGGLETE
jgi:hypothetical protein